MGNSCTQQHNWRTNAGCGGRVPGQGFLSAAKGLRAATASSSLIRWRRASSTAAPEACGNGSSASPKLCAAASPRSTDWPSNGSTSQSAALSSIGGVRQGLRREQQVDRLIDGRRDRLARDDAGLRRHAAHPARHPHAGRLAMHRQVGSQRLEREETEPLGERPALGLGRLDRDGARDRSDLRGLHRARELRRHAGISPARRAWSGSPSMTAPSRRVSAAVHATASSSTGSPR